MRWPVRGEDFKLNPAKLTKIQKKLPLPWSFLHTAKVRPFVNIPFTFSWPRTAMLTIKMIVT
jgi:hypothetical protein